MIRKIRITNFRSFEDVTIDVTPLTIFVGCNDVGKSNVLRALDLFFNSDNGYRVNWRRDFCNFAPDKVHKAKEIKIQITYELPNTYQQSTVVWTRTWRQDTDRGYHDEEIKEFGGQELTAKSRARAFLRSIRYDYIPAIKDSEYFAQLLSKIHDMLDQTVQSDIRKASEGFTDEIRKHVDSILKELDTKLG